MVCQHIFKRGQDGEVACLLCLVPDDEMEPNPTLNSDIKLDGSHQRLYPKLGDEDFWATQISFE